MKIYRTIIIVSLCWSIICFILLLTYYLDTKFYLASKMENEYEPSLFAIDIKEETQIERPQRLLRTMRTDFNSKGNI